MEWLMNNWYVVVGLLCVGAIIGMAIYHFVLLPSEQKMKLFKNSLAELCVKAEELLGSGTGKEKLEYVYNAIKKQFPLITLFMSSEEFNSLVNDALIRVGIWLKK